MSELAMTSSEMSQLDSQVEKMMDWAKTRKAEAEQLAKDSARLMSCTGDRVSKLKNQGFFKRCWNRFTGKSGEMERANTNDLIRMQKMSMRYLNMLQEQQLLMAHSMLSLKNNLYALAVQEEDTRNLVTCLAENTLRRFQELETRVDQLEVSTSLQGWLLGLEEREYEEKIPTENMRLFRVINDFYGIKNDSWNYNDLMFMRKAIRTVGLDPKQKLSIKTFIGSLVDEINVESVGFDNYQKAICVYAHKGITDFSKFVVDEISSPVFLTLHGVKTQFLDRKEMIEELSDEMSISPSEALKRLLNRSISNMNVNIDYEFPLAETAIEILGCLRLANQLANVEPVEEIEQKEDVIEINTNDEITLPDDHFLRERFKKSFSAFNLKKYKNFGKLPFFERTKPLTDNKPLGWASQNTVLFSNNTDLELNDVPDGLSVCLIDGIKNVKINCKIPFFTVINGAEEVRIDNVDNNLLVIAKNVYLEKVQNKFNYKVFVIAENIFIAESSSLTNNDFIIARNNFMHGLKFPKNIDIPFEKNENEIKSIIGSIALGNANCFNKDTIVTQINCNATTNEQPQQNKFVGGIIAAAAAATGAAAAGLAFGGPFGVAAAVAAASGMKMMGNAKEKNQSSDAEITVETSSNEFLLSASNFLFETGQKCPQSLENNPIHIYNTAKEVFENFLKYSNIFTEKYWCN